MPNQVKTTFTADTKAQDRAVVKLQADLAKYQSQRERDEQRLTRTIEREAESRYRVQVRAQQRATQDILRELRKVETEEQRIAQRNAGYRQTVAGVIVGGALGAGYLAHQAIDKAVEQARANRLLASAATEAGVGQDKLVEANKRFAASVGLANTAAAQTTAQIQRLATYSGRPGDVDKLLKAFADLGAARGIGGRDLETLIGTILSGQDEGLNRLGIGDPGQLQRAYAASIGKTTEQLTQQEKVQAAVNAVMEKAAIFTGAAEARMNSLEGQVAKTSAAWSNFTDSLSTAVTTSGPVTDFLNAVSGAVKSLGSNIDDVQQKLQQGKTPEQIVAETYNRPSVGDFVTAGATDLFLRLGDPSGLIGRAFFSDAVDPFKVFARRQKEELDRIRAEAQNLKNQALAAEQQAAAPTASPYDSYLDAIRAQRDGVPQTLEQQAQAAQAASRAAEIEAEKRQRAAEELRRQMDEFRRARIAAFDSIGTSTDNPFLAFLTNANRDMRSLVELTNKLPKGLGDAVLANQRNANTRGYQSLQIQNALDAVSLRQQAGEFRQGYRNDLSDAATVQRLIDEQLRAIPIGLRYTRASDEALMRIGQSTDPRLLRWDQRTDIASALDREAERKEQFESAGLDFYQKMVQHIQAGFPVKIGDSQSLVRIVNEAPDSARVTTRPRAANVADHYVN